MIPPTEKDILKLIEGIDVKKQIDFHNATNLTFVGKVNSNNISTSRTIFVFKTNMKKIIKSLMYVIYKIIKKPLNIFLRIVDPSIYQSGQEIEMLRNENRLLKQKLLDAK